VVVNSVKYCRADFLPIVRSSPQTLLIADSMPGDPVGGGTRAAHSSDNSVLQVSTQLNGRRISILVTTGQSTYWSIQLDAPEGSVLAPGSYPHATRSPFARFNGLSVSSPTVSCNELSGRFIVYELSISNGDVQSLSADVEQHCNEATAALFLAVRYRASYAEHRPFGGNYPRYELTVTPSPHGSVMGDGIDCGAGAACALSSATARTVTLTATPDEDYIFAGWTGGCSGAETTSIVLNSVKHCQARFERAVPTAARTLAVFSGESGHYVSAGQKRVFSPSNSLWSVSRTSSGNTITVRIHAREGARENLWTLYLSAPSGSALQTGTYSVPASYSSTAPRMAFFGDGRACTDTGTFTIRQLSTDPLTGVVSRLDVDFEHHCYDLANPRMIGSVQYRSTVDVVAWRHDINGDGRPDLFWQHERDGWIASWEMDGTRLLNARTTTPDRVADTNWRIISTADFNADGRPDLFWQHRQTGLMAVWYMTGSTYLGPGLLSNNTVSDLNWQIRAVADFNGDSSPDLLWQHDLTGMLVVWVLDGMRLVEARVLSPSTVSDTNWKVEGAADFNADGQQDLLWRNRATGELVVWYMNGTTLTSGAPLSPGVVADRNWEIRALADINDDGSPDVIWQRRSDGWLSAWLMNGVTMMSGAGFQPAQVADTAWRIVGPR
jgi:hypothetical protein